MFIPGHVLENFLKPPSVIRISQILQFELSSARFLEKTAPKFVVKLEAIDWRQEQR
jgi:hypothetical protein